MKVYKLCFTTVGLGVRKLVESVNVINVIRDVINSILDEQPISKLEYVSAVEYELSKKLEAVVDYRSWVDTDSVLERVFGIAIDDVTSVTITYFDEIHEIEVRKTDSRVCFDVYMEGYEVELARSQNILQFYIGCKLKMIEPKVCP
jgi:hypothetical protein